MQRSIRTADDVMRMLDQLFADGADRWTIGASAWWDRFYSDPGAAVPFFTPKPDEHLVSYLDRALIGGRFALELGCGQGRNAVHLAALGFDVDAVDLSATALAVAERRVREAGVKVRFHRADIFAADHLTGPYDLVYDTGCLHHLPPHRRVGYLELLGRVLAPGGHLALACFAAGAMGSELTDAECYRDRSLHGGLAYSPESLRWIFSDLEEIEIRPMIEQPPASPLLGVPFLLTALFRKPAAPERRADHG